LLRFLHFSKIRQFSGFFGAPPPFFRGEGRFFPNLHAPNGLEIPPTSEGMQWAARQSSSAEERKMSILNLSSYSSITELRAALRDVVSKSENVCFLMDGEDVIMLTPGARAKEAIAKRIAEKLAECPSHLSELMDRLEKETAEDWE
jgi:hypothetical protein